jgi:hypothetical protein
VNDFVSAAAYRVVPIQAQDPTRDLTVVKDPAGKEASPLGWHKSKKEFSTTQGNNAMVYSIVRPGAKRYFPDGGSELDFTAQPDFKKPPTEGPNRDAAIVNLFYGKRHLLGFYKA